MENADTPSHSSIRRGVFDDELHNIREYRHGDNPRAVHWRTTARKGELMVREFEQEREAETTILLDLWRSEEWTEELEELAVSLVATICDEQAANSHSGGFGLLIAGKKLADVRCAGGSAFRRAALDALAVCQSATEVDLTPLADAACRAAGSGNGCCIVVTGRSEQFWEATTEIASEISPSGIALHGRIIVLPILKERIQEFFRPADNVVDLQSAAGMVTNRNPMEARMLQEAS